MVTNCIKLSVVMGVMCLIFGVIAVAKGQPYGVWYTLVLVGVLETAISISGLIQFSRVYAQRELQQMNALDS